jgi:glycerol-3-phosphate acyltransferase PlsX
MMRIAVDAMGGDRAPRVVVDGAVAAARHHGIGVTLVGLADQVGAALARHRDAGRLDLRVVAATDIIADTEAPAVALRRKPGASIRVAAGLVASGEAAALFSAGHTGATVVAACTGLGLLPGTERPALAATIPTQRGAAVLLDVGANADCRPHHLVTFAVMGAVFARVALGVAEPRVGLLSIGEEETKGNELTREVHRLLKASGLNFTGNIEARDVYAGGADVIVCDGFTGNIAIKVSEGLVEMIAGLLREAVEAMGPDVAPRVAAGLFGAFERRVDDSEYGAVPLLGVAGLAMVGHGRSSSKAVRQGILAAHRFASSGFIARLQAEIAASGESTR